jgi:hypothetical protein
MGKCRKPWKVVLGWRILNHAVRVLREVAENVIVQVLHRKRERGVEDNPSKSVHLAIHLALQPVRVIGRMPLQEQPRISRSQRQQRWCPPQRRPPHPRARDPPQPRPVVRCHSAGWLRFCNLQPATAWAPINRCPAIHPLLPA